MSKRVWRFVVNGLRLSSIFVRRLGRSISPARAGTIFRRVMRVPVKRGAESARPNHRNRWFKAATITGVLAVGSMLGWQVTSWLAAAAQDASQQSETAGSSGQRKTAVSSKTIKEPPVSGSEVSAQSDASTVGNPFQPVAISEESVLAALPDDLRPGGNIAVHSSVTVERKTDRTDEPKGDGYAPAPLSGAPPIARKKTLESPFQPRATAVSATEQSKSPASERQDIPRFSLEVVRIAVSGGPSGHGRFLVNSAASQNGEADRTGVRPRPRSAATQSDDWGSARAPKRAAVLRPAGHGRASTTKGTVLTQRAGQVSSAKVRWLVAGPKLRLEIDIPRTVAVGDRVAVQIRVTNADTSVAENVVLHVELPAELKYSIGRKLALRIGRLEPGKVHVARLTPTAVRTGTPTFTARIVADGVSATAAREIQIAAKKAAAASHSP